MLNVIVGFTMGLLVGYFVFRNGDKMTENNLTVDKKSVKRENLEKIRSFLVGKQEVRNNEIENLLGVSDATSERYLDELEAEGKLKQVGKTGKYTHYKVL